MTAPLPELTEPMTDVVAAFVDPEEGGALPAEALRWLIDRGVPADSLRGIRATKALFHPTGCYTPSYLGAFSFWFAILDDGAFLDLAAWCPATGEMGTRFGRGYALGQEQAGETEGRLWVWKSPLAWLRAGRRGIVILNDGRAAHALSEIPLRPEEDDPDFAQELDDKLRVLPPRILCNRLTPRAA